MQHTPPKFRRRTPALWVLAAAVLAGQHAAAVDSPPQAQQLEDPADIEALVQSQAPQFLPPPGERQRLQVGPLPPKLPLARCRGSLSAAPAPGLRQPGRLLMEVRCESVPWHVYVPVRVIGTSPVLIAAHALIPGVVLTDKDMRLEQRDMNQLPQGYLDDPAIAVGLTAARGISAGAPLTNQMLLGTKVVQRGQTVTLIATNGGFSVRMAGRAMSDGLINQRVRVENLSSGKVVEGIARSEQVVEIIFQ